MYWPLGQEIEQIPDGGIGVNATIIVFVKLCADGVAVIDCTVRRARDDAQTRVLRAVRALHAKVAIASFGLKRGVSKIKRVSDCRMQKKRGSTRPN